MLGQPMQGDWVLSVSDLVSQDVGRLRNWNISLLSAAVGVSQPNAVT